MMILKNKLSGSASSARQGLSDPTVDMMFFYRNQMLKSEKIRNYQSPYLPHPLGPHYEENNETVTVAFRNLSFKYHNQNNFKQ